jgi:hypothetical protein
MRSCSEAMGRHVTDKVAEWVRRYLPAECIGLVCALIGGVAAHAAFDNPVATALGGSWGETAGYYATMLRTEIKARRGTGGSAVAQVRHAVRNLLVEFTGAELVDSVAIRPAAIYALTDATGNLLVGLVLGKLAADVAFYIPVIIAYEMRKKYLSG